MTRSKIQRMDGSGGSGSWLAAGQSTFGSFVKRSRTTRQLPRRRVAEDSGIPEQRLELIEVNQVVPGYRDIKGLANALKVPEHELLEAAGYVAPK